MRNLHDHDTNLCTYMKAMSVLCLKHDIKIKTDTQPNGCTPLHFDAKNDQIENSDLKIPDISNYVRKSVAGEELRNLRLEMTTH